MQYIMFSKNTKQERGENMTDTLEEKKDDAKELVDILARIPEERKREAIGIIKGFALCAEKEE